MQNDTAARLRRLRGSPLPKRHNARTIAALTANPGCTRRAVLDAAGIDKDGLAGTVGFPAPFGQSPFAIARGNAFEAQVKANGGAELLRLLREVLGIDLATAGYLDLETVSGDDQDQRHALARTELSGALRTDRETNGSGTLFDHPLLRLEVAGQRVYLEPDLVAFQHAGRFHIVEIKSFAVIDGQADGDKVAAAAIQSAVYVLALRRILGRPDAVSHEVVLVCPKDFTNTPTAALVDVRRQLIILEHQLSRLARIDALLDAVPPDLSLDLGMDASGLPNRSAADLLDALSKLPARYAPDCLSRCELSYLCREQAAGSTAALGVSVREALGGVETVAEVLALADGVRPPAPEQADAAAMLRAAAHAYAHSTG